MLLFISLLSLVVLLLSNKTLAQGYSCYDFKFKPIVCRPGPEKLGHGRIIDVTPNMTCGTPPSGYCRTSQPLGCYQCNASSFLHRHPSRYLTDNDNPLNFQTSGFKQTWWQSVTWWDAKQQSLLVNDILKVKLTLSMNKTYDLTGTIKVTFYSSKPHAFVFEKSSDYGLTWIPYRYYADDCTYRFPNVSNKSSVKTALDVYCVEDKSVTAVQGSQVTFEPHYTADNLWTNITQQYLKATDFRISLEYPWTDGNEVINQEPFLNQYYYDISDIQIKGRCHCNGHAPYCFGPNINEQKCYCQHNTDGIDCEMCLPLYNNKPWKHAESPTKPNPCEACECNGHSKTCTYNATVGFGVCDDCLHGTTGYNCDQCKELYYRNTSVSLSDVRACVACDCFMAGVTSNGSCLQKSTDDQEAGQCFCKPDVIGRKCDKCKFGYFGIQTGNCSACNCSLFGTFTDKGNTCDQITGQCMCKNTTHSRTCSRCKPGFYSFPTSKDHECEECSCDMGGSVNNACNQITGACTCRRGVYGSQCKSTIPGNFFPFFDYYTLEAESGAGIFQIKSAANKADLAFTGFGYAVISSEGYVEVTFNSVDFLARYFLVLRYVKSASDIDVNLELSYTNKTLSFSLFHEKITLLNGTSMWQRKNPIVMVKGANYSIKLSTNFSTPVKIDSIIVMPDYMASKLYLKSSDALKLNISSCWKESRYINKDKHKVCRAITFSTTAEWFNGTLACNCDLTGAVNPMTCDSYGGQCVCKPGVMGRRCNECKPGFFNFTQNGCQACNCDPVGSEDSACDRFTGQCSCKPNVSFRTCNACIKDFYGIESTLGCRDCLCNKNGSLSSQCRQDGQCLCHNSTVGFKCDRCRENYFNFTKNGCSYCGCSMLGSLVQQCDLYNGICPCKENVELKKCSACKLSFFNLNQTNSKGCQECFCFNKTAQCSSAGGYQEVDISFDPTTWNLPNFIGDVANNCLVVNVTKSVPIISLPASYTGNLLYLFHQRLFLNLNVHNGNGSLPTLAIRFTGTNNNSFSLLPANTSYQFHVIHNWVLERISLLDLQTVLFDVKNIDIVVQVGNASHLEICDFRMSHVEKLSNGVQFSGVEKCSCPQNYTGNSCQFCAKGYFRKVFGSGSLGKCILCQCNGRSQTCDQETGVCSNCRVGTTGQYCETCEPNVQEPDCLACKRGYYGYENADFSGCRACDCAAKNTIPGVSDVCDVVTGQCPCKADIGGRACDRCAENSVNITDECKPCSECHLLIQKEVHMLRGSLKELKLLTENNTHTHALLSNTTLTNLLINLTTSVMSMIAQANESTILEEKVMAELFMLNETLDAMETRLKINISRDIDLIRSRVPSMLSYENISSFIVNTTYNLLWTSVYVINTNIKPALEVVPRKIISLQEMAGNFSNMSLAYKSVYSPVLRDIYLILNTTSYVLQRTSTASKIRDDIEESLNKTQAEVNDLKAAIQPTNVLVKSLLNDSETFLESSILFLHFANNTLIDVRNATVNHSSFAMLDIAKQANRITRQISELSEIHRTLNSSQERVSTMANEYMNTSSATLQLSHERNKNLSMLVAEIYQAQAIVDNATKLSNETYSTAIQLLSVVKNFNVTLGTASQAANESIMMAGKVNETNEFVFAEINKTTLLIREYMGNASKVFNLSRNASDGTSSQNQMLKEMHFASTNLAHTSLQLSINWNQSIELIQNITNITTQNIQTAKKCNDLTNTANQLLFESKTALRLSESSLVVKKQDQKRLANIMVNIQSVNTLNETILLLLRKSFNESRQLFDGLNIQKAIPILKKSSTTQKEDIASYKEQLRSLRREIDDMKKMYDVIKGVKGCG